MTITTSKYYTDLSQAKKLAETLPIESADMFCADVFDKEKKTHSYNFHILSTWGYNTFEELKDRENKFVHFIPVWSLAALLSVLPFHIIINNQRYAFMMHKGLGKDGETYCLKYNVFNTDVCLYSTAYYTNPVDAAYEMIIKLYDRKLL